jgi:hypothetical protein
VGTLECGKDFYDRPRSVRRVRSRVRVPRVYREDHQLLRFLTWFNLIVYGYLLPNTVTEPCLHQELPVMLSPHSWGMTSNTVTSPGLEPRVYSTKDVAKILGVSKGHVHRQIRADGAVYPFPDGTYRSAVTVGP